MPSQFMYNVNSVLVVTKQGIILFVVSMAWYNNINNSCTPVYLTVTLTGNVWNMVFRL